MRLTAATLAAFSKYPRESGDDLTDPAVVRWYLGNRERMAEVEAVVVENNVTNHVLGLVKVVDKAVPFDELMVGS